MQRPDANQDDERPDARAGYVGEARNVRRQERVEAAKQREGRDDTDDVEETGPARADIEEGCDEKGAGRGQHALERIDQWQGAEIRS